jgi:sulfur transfer protein SufE
MVVDSIQALRTLGVATTHFVFAAIGVGEITCATRHDGLNAMFRVLRKKYAALLSIIVQKYLKRNLSLHPLTR